MTCGPFPLVYFPDAPEKKTTTSKREPSPTSLKWGFRFSTTGDRSGAESTRRKRADVSSEEARVFFARISLIAKWRRVISVRPVRPASALSALPQCTKGETSPSIVPAGASTHTRRRRKEAGEMAQYNLRTCTIVYSSSRFSVFLR